MLLKHRSVSVECMAESLSNIFARMANVKKLLRNCLALAIFSSLFLLPATAEAKNFDRGHILIGENLFEIKIARDEMQRQIGLSKLSKDKQNYFMLFIFESPQRVSFWMKDTNIDLSIAFIDEKQYISEIQSMKANSLQLNTSLKNDIKYALEVPKGFFKRKNIRTGDFVQIFQ